MWIKVDQKLIDHPKTFALAEMLDLEEVQVVGYLVALWCYAADHWPKGVLPQNDKQIAQVCRWNGPAEPFVRALVHAGFVDDDYMGEMKIHDFDEYVGAMLMRRAAERQRLANLRAKKGRKFS